jgi:hypothetical protein
MKVHLAKKLSGNRITLTRSECGKKAYSRNNQVLMIMKTTKFKENLDGFGEEYTCKNCLSKAKEQNRI